MLDAVPAELIGSVFCDSLEVYGADWTPVLPEEFARRRGYPLLPMLHLLVVDGPGAPGCAPTTTAPWPSSTRRTSSLSPPLGGRPRGAVPDAVYGTPPATVSSYRFADLFEGEGWGWNEITQTRWAASAAHLYGRPEVSAEVWTWVHSPSFRATPLDLKGEAHEHLLNGVNQLIGHGWPYSPAERPGLGWFFYAAGALDDRNPWWPAMPELNAHLSRLCWLLRQGEPVADVAVYVPDEDLFAAMGTADRRLARHLARGPPPNPRCVPATIRAAGLDYDLIDDDALGVTDPDRYRWWWCRSRTTVPAATTHWFDRVRDRAQRPRAVTEVTSDGLSDALLAAVRPDLVISPPSSTIGSVHRREDGRGGLSPRQHRAGDTDLRGHPAAGSGELRAVGRDDRPAASRRSRRRGHRAHAAALRGDRARADRRGDVRRSTRETARSSAGCRSSDGWRVAFGDRTGAAGRPAARLGGRAGPPALLGIGDLHDHGRPRRPVPGRVSARPRRARGPRRRREPSTAWSGPSYRAAVRGPVGEIAQVRVNGMDCGVAWAPPYRVDVTAALRSGANRIEIIVSNTAANALAADEHIVQLAAESEARYGRRFRMQELDQAMATVRSGLLRVPTLVVSRP